MTIKFSSIVLNDYPNLYFKFQNSIGLVGSTGGARTGRVVSDLNRSR